MLLSGEQFAEINAGLTEQVAGRTRIIGPGANITNAKIKVAAVVQGKSAQAILAVLKQFSPEKAVFFLPTAWPVGQKFVAEFPSKSGKSINLLGAVRKVTETDAGSWVYECEFICLIAATRASEAAEIHRISSSMLDW